MNILLVKLITGEEVISEVEIKEDTTILTKPTRLVPTHDGIAVVPMSPFSKSEKFTIPNEHIMYTSVPDDEILNAYNSKFGSGLVMASGLNLVT